VSLEIPLFGALFIPLCLLCLGSLDRLLCLTVFFAAFEAASVLNITLGGTSFGLPPAYFSGAAYCLLSLIGRIGRPAGTPRSDKDGRALYIALPFLAFLGYAVLSAYAFPRLWAGAVSVWPQRLDPTITSMVPLTPSSGNTTQTLYLLIFSGLLVFTLLATQARPALAGSLLRAYLLSGFTAVVFGFWQFASTTVGIPYPEDLLYSNPNWVFHTAEDFGGLFRLTGPFSEAAGLASFLGGLIFATFWLVVRGSGGRMFASLVLGSAVLLMALCTSTTGYVVVAVGLPLGVVFGLRAGPAVARRLVTMVAVLSLIASAAVFIAPVAAPQLVESANAVTEQTLRKSESQSFEDRSGKDFDSLALVGPTFGFGTGWGSVRASSLLTTLLGAIGLWGVLLLVWFVIRTVRLLRRCPDGGQDRDGLIVETLMASVIGMLAAALISSPNLAYAGFWINLGSGLGLALHRSQSLQLPRPRPRPIDTRERAAVQ
jgi:hypothetical protein